MKITLSALIISFLGLLVFSATTLTAEQTAAAADRGFITHRLGNLAVDISPELAEAYPAIRMEMYISPGTVLEVPFKDQADGEREFAENFRESLGTVLANNDPPQADRSKATHLSWSKLDEISGRPASFLTVTPCTKYLGIENSRWMCTTDIQRLWLKLDKGFLIFSPFSMKPEFFERLDETAFDQNNERLQERLVTAAEGYLARYTGGGDDSESLSGGYKTDLGRLIWPDDQPGPIFGLSLVTEAGSGRKVTIGAFNGFRLQTVNDVAQLLGLNFDFDTDGEFKNEKLKTVLTSGFLLESRPKKIKDHWLIPLWRMRTVAGRPGLEKIYIDEEQNAKNTLTWVEWPTTEAMADGVLVIFMYPNTFYRDSEDENTKPETLRRHWNMFLDGFRPEP